MKNLVKLFFFGKKMELEIPVPSRFPEQTNVVEWMNQRVIYYSQKFPDSLHKLFSPYFGDYLPLAIVAGTNTVVFNQHLNEYRELKAKYPEAVKKAKESYSDVFVSRVGDPEDFQRK